MVYTLMHVMVIVALLVKAASSILGVYSADPLWFHISGISSGVSVLLGVLWAIVFLHGDNFARIPKAVRILLPAAAALAVASIIISS